MRYLNTTETQQYLEDVYGMRYSISALNKYRMNGTGPRFVKLNGKLWYRDSDIDEWVSSAVHVNPGGSGQRCTGLKQAEL